MREDRRQPLCSDKARRTERKTKRVCFEDDVPVCTDFTSPRGHDPFGGRGPGRASSARQRPEASVVDCVPCSGPHGQSFQSIPTAGGGVVGADPLGRQPTLIRPRLPWCTVICADSVSVLAGVRHVKSTRTHHPGRQIDVAKAQCRSGPKRPCSDDDDINPASHGRSLFWDRDWIGCCHWPPARWSLQIGGLRESAVPNHTPGLAGPYSMLHVHCPLAWFWAEDGIAKQPLLTPPFTGNTIDGSHTLGSMRGSISLASTHPA